MTDTATRRAHPHDPLTADEVRRAVAAVKESGRVPDGTLFATVAVDEPDRAEVAAFAAGGAARPSDPTGGASRPRGGGRRGGGPDGRRLHRRMDPPRRRAPGPALRRRLPLDPRPEGRPGVAGGHGAPRHHRLRPRPDRPLADRQLRTGHGGRSAHHPLPQLLPRGSVRQRLRPAGGGRAGHRRRGPGRRPRGDRLRGGAPRPRAGQLPARAQRAVPRRPADPRDHPARRGELHRWTATCSPGSTGRCACP